MMNTLPVAFASMPGGLEWVVIGLIALLLFGKRLPGIARSLGQAMTEFKSGLAGVPAPPAQETTSQEKKSE